MTSEFIPKSAFKTNRASAFRFIVSHILRHPFYAILMVFGALSNAVLAAAVPYFIGRAFQDILDGAGLEAAGNVAILIIISQVIRASLQLMRNFSAEVFAQRFERDIRDELYANLLGKSMTFHGLQPVGEIMARVTNDVREMNLMMNPGMNLLIGSGFFLIMPVFAAVQLHPQLIITPLLFLILYAVSQYFYMRKLSPIGEEVRENFGAMNARVAEVLDGLQVVKGAAQEDREKQIFDAEADDVRNSTVRQSDMEALYIPILLLGLVTACAFIHSAYLYSIGEVEISVIVTFTGQIALFGFPVFTSLASFSQLSLGYAGAKRILEIMNTENDLDQNLQGADKVIEGGIRFENVDFAYGDGSNTLHNISFNVKPGQTVAIAGQTGSGKSSITKLINRTYDADKGRVFVDDIDVKDWNLSTLRSQISIIEQDIYLFSRSIADNIRFGKPEASMEEVIDAAKKAQAHDFIMTFDDGYETKVGQRGVTLSGGQRQRIAIARAFVTNPPILILDDSTSAIDSATEDQIQRAIWTAAKDRTTIIITHRLSQIRWADHIVVLRRGHVVAQGTHDELLATSEDYGRIFARYETPRQRIETPNNASSDLTLD